MTRSEMIAGLIKDELASEMHPDLAREIGIAVTAAIVAWGIKPGSDVMASFDGTVTCLRNQKCPECGGRPAVQTRCEWCGLYGESL